MMKSSIKILSVLLASLTILWMTTGTSYAQQTPGQLFEKALYAEEVEGDLAEAIVLYQQVLAENPDNRQLAARAILHKGLCYEKLGSEQARQSYRDVINRFPEQAEEADIARERMTSLDAYVAELNTKAEQHMKQGNELFKMWAYEDAIKEYEDAITLRPNTLLAMNAQYSIGHSLYRAGNYEDALLTFTNLIDENPKSNIAPVTELMLSQVQYAMENNENKSIARSYSDESTIVDPETGITFRKIKALTGASDIISYETDLNLSPNGKFLLFGNMVVPIDGTAPFELIDFSSTGLHVTRGTWSPDGTKAAFYSGDALCVVPVSHETGHATGPYKKIDEAKLKYQINPGWSPDGKKLTYSNSKGHMWIIDSEGNDLQQIAKSEIIRGGGPAWSPEGKSIAFVKSNGIGLYNIENDKVSELAKTDYRAFPVWSPDGKWIVSAQFEKLHFYDLDRKSEFEFSPPKETGRFFSWLKNGNKLLSFRTSYFSNSGLKIASPDGGPSYEPVPLLTNWWKTRWSDDSKLMVVQGEDEEGNIVIRIVPLSGGESDIIQLDNLPDGKLFPFNISSNIEQILCSLEHDDGKEDLYVVPISAPGSCTTGPPVKIFSKYKGEGPCQLSPDGKRLALIHEGNIWLAFTNGNNPVQVTDYQDMVGYVEWTRDGKALLFSVPSGWRLMEDPGSQGKVIELLDEGKKIECSLWEIDISPDGSRMAFTAGEHLKIVPLDESGSGRILNLEELDLIEFGELAWSPDGENLAFIGIKERPVGPVSSSYERRCQIYNISMTGGPPTRVAPNDNDWKDELSWSPDGNWIAYSPSKPVKVRPESTIWEADFEEIIEKLSE
jgi:Tol biopolymer transport system component/TolA-binding protein